MSMSMAAAGGGGTAFGGGTLPTILCCICSVSIIQNPANMCVNCIRSTVDITEGIIKQQTVHSCRGCQRFLGSTWQNLQLESKELMSLCLRKIPGLKHLKLIDAVWIWTEPHSMRLKIKITVQKEVIGGAILQQASIIEYQIRNQQCKDCEKSYATGTWHAVAQVRQRVSHKRTFFYLEQILLKYKAHADCINIVTFKDGMDFYFNEKQQCLKFIDFLTHHIPVKWADARKLVSSDKKNGTAEFKNNFYVEIAPVCKDDLVILPRELASNLSDISPLCLVKGIGGGIRIVDPFSGERQEVNVEKYWRSEFPSLMNSRQLMQFMVLSVEPLLKAARPTARKRGNNKKMMMAEIVVCREKDLGVNDEQFTVVSHLGNILKEGDICLGYDLTHQGQNEQSTFIGTDTNSKSNPNRQFPDIVLVRKHYQSAGERFWQLKSLEELYGESGAPAESSGGSARATAKEEDYEEFLQELEGDKEMRANINLYKNARATDASSSRGGSRAAVMVEEEEESTAVSKKDLRKVRKTGERENASSMVIADKDSRADELAGQMHRLREETSTSMAAAVAVSTNPFLGSFSAKGGSSSSNRFNAFAGGLPASRSIGGVEGGEDSDEEEDEDTEDVKISELLDDLSLGFSSISTNRDLHRDTVLLTADEANRVADMGALLADDTEAASSSISASTSMAAGGRR